MDKSNVFKAVAAAIFVVIIGIATIYVWSGLLGEDRTILQTAEYYATGQIKLPDAEEKLAKKLKMTERAQIANRVSELAAKLRNEDKTEEADKVARLATDLGTAEVGAADLGVEITTLGVPPTTTPLTAKTMAEVCAALDNAWAAEKWDEVIAILEANRDNQLACPPGSWESPYLSIAEKLFAAHYNNCEYARRQNDKTKAVAQCTRALALKPNDPQAAALLQQVSGGAVGGVRLPNQRASGQRNGLSRATERVE